MDKKLDGLMAKFGLIGRHINYSFSRSYFNTKFKNENLPHEYVNYDLAALSYFPKLLKKDSSIAGLNVTTPYKEQIIPYLDKLNKKAKKITAVNTIKISKSNKLIGYNTDYYGFKKSIKPLIKQKSYKALILGTGGAAKAVALALQDLNVPFCYVSRYNKSKSIIKYRELNSKVIYEHKLIINCTPVGTFPKVLNYPNIPYKLVSKDHVLYDLIYNPEETEFLKRGRLQGAQITNGLQMLNLQAEKSWEIWNR